MTPVETKNVGFGGSPSYNEKNIAKSMTVWKLCERSAKCDLAGCPNFNRLEMTLGWRRGGQECQSWLQQQ